MYVEVALIPTPEPEVVVRSVASGAVILLFGLSFLLMLSESPQAAARGFPASSPPYAPWSKPLARYDPSPSLTSPVFLRIRPPTSPVPIGESITVDLLLENVDPLFGIDLTVTYDQTLLALEAILPGPLFPDGQRYILTLDPPSPPGKVRYVSTLLGDVTPAASTGVLATLRFRTIASGYAQLAWDEASLQVCDRESVLLPWIVENGTLIVAQPTATPTTASSSSGAADPRPTSTPRPTHTPHPTHTPVATRTPRPTATLRPTRTPRPTSTPRPLRTRRPRATGTPGGYPWALPEELEEMGSDGLLFPEPTLGPTVPLFYPEELPSGVPPVSEDGVVAIMGSEPGVGIIQIPFGDSQVELRVDNQGSPMAVRFQPYPELPSDVSLPPDIAVARVFSLDLYSYDFDSNSASRILYDGDRTSAPIVLKWVLGSEDYSRILDEAGNPHPGRFVFYRISPEGYLVKIETAWAPDPDPYGTLTALFVDRSTFVLALLPPEQEGNTLPVDSRYFRETGYQVSRDSFWDYFQKRGGINSFGYPISRVFLLEGFPVQLFQRALLQQMPDGSVATMNLLDSGLMPYTRINGSSFPAPDPVLIDAAPSPSEPGYADQAVAFVEANVPDSWDGLPVNFQRSFFSRVGYEDAFPNGHGEPALLPLMNLELWGLPTSKPAYDPTNHNFVYQRFQRGILHYDRTNGTTQGLLLGEYLKAVMTGRNLPPDLEAQAQGSPFFTQYDLGSTGHIAREEDLPGSILVGAFEMDVPQEIVGGDE